MITQEIKDKLTAAGCNYSALVGRFMNMDKLAEKFLKKLPNDDNIAKFGEAAKAGDAQGLFTAAHTLKGLCGNLCIENILTEIDPIVEAARGGSTEGSVEVYEKIKVMYDDICAIIAEIG